MAERYGIYGQITGRDIIQGGNVIDLIELTDKQYVSAVAIHTDPTREVMINNSDFYIDERGTIQFYDTKITSIKFPINEDWPIDDSTVVTFAITEEEY